MHKTLFLFLALSTIWCQAQDSALMKTQVRHTIDELVEFVAIPNDALNPADINRNITWLSDKFSERGFNTSVLPSEGQPLCFEDIPMDTKKPNILFYMHFDAQSIDPSNSYLSVTYKQ